MALVWQYGEKSGYEAWKGLSWGMVSLFILFVYYFLINLKVLTFSMIIYLFHCYSAHIFPFATASSLFSYPHLL